MFENRERDITLTLTVGYAKIWYVFWNIGTRTVKAQDILIALKLLSLEDQYPDKDASAWPQRLLAEETGVGLSQVNAACRRLEAIGLLSPGKRRIARSALLEFLLHGLKYVFPFTMGQASRGMPTGYAAEPLRDQFLSGEAELVPVWPDPHGTVRGLAVKPLYRTVPMACRKDQRLYEYLALVDAVRGGRARERKKAIEVLTRRLGA